MSPGRGGRIGPCIDVEPDGKEIVGISRLPISNGVNFLPSFVTAVEKSGWQVSCALEGPWTHLSSYWVIHPSSSGRESGFVRLAIVLLVVSQVGAGVGGFKVSLGAHEQRCKL
jgi:hypothetical protein